MLGVYYSVCGAGRDGYKDKYTKRQYPFKANNRPGAVGSLVKKFSTATHCYKYRKQSLQAAGTDNNKILFAEGEVWGFILVRFRCIQENSF